MLDFGENLGARWNENKRNSRKYFGARAGNYRRGIFIFCARATSYVEFGRAMPRIDLSIGSLRVRIPNVRVYSNWDESVPPAPSYLYGTATQTVSVLVFSRRLTSTPGSCIMNRRSRRTDSPPGRKPNRKGTILVLSAFLMIVMFSMVAFSVDLGYILVAQSEIQRSVDAASLAGVGMLVEGEDAAIDTATQYLARNPVADPSSVGLTTSQQLTAFQQNHSDDYDISVGHWDPAAVDPVTGQQGTMVSAGDTPASAVHVVFQLRDQPLFFAPLLGTDTFNVQGEAIAVYQPRDIVLVLDYSGSMNDDTEFKAIDTIGQEALEANLLQCWHDIDSQTWGSLTFQPQYLTVSNTADQPGEPLITVEYRYRSVHVTSSADLQWVKLMRSDGNVKKFNASGNSGTFSYYNWPLYKVRVKSNGYKRTFNFHPNVIDDVIKDAFGLTMPYPYNGSWEGFFHFAKYDSDNRDAGYRYQFGMMNLIAYWLKSRAGYSQTPILYQMSAQPVTAVKESVDVFMDYITEVDTDDRVGLSVYNSSSGNGYLEQELTNDVGINADIAWARQAGHYHSYTNIGGGMETALDELLANGRAGARKVMVLMTDGNANWTDDGYDLGGADQYALEFAEQAAAHNIPIVTISLGAYADADLMQQIADITNGQHYNVPWNQSIAVVESELKDVFRAIADDRPMKIVR